MIHIPSLTFSPDKYHYGFGLYDRVSIDGLPYKVPQHGRNEEGWLLELDDGSGRSTVFPHTQLSRLGSMGHIRVERSLYAPDFVKRRLLTEDALISELDPKPSARLTKRNAYCEAFFELEKEGLIKITDDSINANRDLLRSRAMSYVDRLIGGIGSAVSQDLNNTPSARTLRRWLKDYRNHGPRGLIDAMNRRGNRNRLMGPEQLSLMMHKVQRYASESQPTMKTIYEDVEKAFYKHNVARKAEGLHPFIIPSYETVRRAIRSLEPYAVTVAREGIAAARKKFAPVGKGLQLTRPLERVEIDENTIDIVSLAETAGLLGLLTDAERSDLGLDKSKARWFLTVAICATTRCILGLVFSRSAKEAASLQVLQMILRDKGQWADATGSLGSWDMHGTPALIVTDNGAAFKAESFRTACADLGITTLRAPAGLPEVRARNERFFHTLNTGLHPRLPGRTFSSIREKGDIDPHRTAALTFDDLAFCLVRWIVDIYHNTPHSGLGGKTPLQCWRRLTSEWGVQTPPHKEDRRIIFGMRLMRKLSCEGVTVLGMRYHSEALARWMLRKTERDVEVRWHPDDIGQVTVYVGGQKFHVGTVHSGFDGFSAREWIAARRELNGVDPSQKTYAHHTVLQAIQAIRDRSTAATKLAGLIADAWSPERIKQEEDRLFIGFNVSSDRKAPHVSSDGIGRRFIDPECAELETPAQESIKAISINPTTDDADTAPRAWKITE